MTIDEWQYFPTELKELDQWCLAGPDKMPLGVRDGHTFALSSTEPSHWMSFAEALAEGQRRGLKLGFVLSKEDPFTCVDLDVKDASNEPDTTKWTTTNQFSRFVKIIEYLDSYTEHSQGGKGLHIWVRGKIGEGCRRDGVELYSQERYIICTGKPLHHKPIAHRQDVLNLIVGEIRAQQAVTRGNGFVELIERDDVDTDAEIFERASSADNATKFLELCDGRYQQYGFPSQSEADLALMSMFTFYSASNEQCRRLFRMTELGKREKAAKNNRYLNYTLRIIRSRQAAEEDIDRAGVEAMLETKLSADRERAELQSIVDRMQGGPIGPAAMLHVPGNHNPSVPVQPAGVGLAMAAPVAAPVVAVAQQGLPWPPGLAGLIAGFIYQNAPRPVKEVAVVAALGLLAGICGKAWGLPQTGLNMYIILVGRSGTGKEAMHQGISSIIHAVTRVQPTISQFVDFSDFASGPALSKATAAANCFVNVAGEWGRKLKRLAREDGDASMASLRSVMTNLYQKSSNTSIVGGIKYSNKDGNVQSVNGVAFSMIGETTPDTLFESLTDSMMSDGFLSRFNIVEYDGPRVALNEAPVAAPDQTLVNALAEICTQAVSLMVRDTVVQVDRTHTAAQLMRKFEDECDESVNSNFDENYRQMYNRASMKAMRIAALLAVADNYIRPIIELHHVEWAQQLVKNDIALMTKRLEAGDIGVGDGSKERKVLKFIKDYLEEPLSPGYKIPDDMKNNWIVPRKYLQIRTATAPQFTTAKNGSTFALDQTLRSLIDNGYLQEVDKAKIVEQYKFHGKAYRVVAAPESIKNTKH